MLFFIVLVKETGAEPFSNTNILDFYAPQLRNGRDTGNSFPKEFWTTRNKSNLATNSETF